METTKKQVWNLLEITETRPWRKVGVAFINEDGSYNIIPSKDLKANTKLQMRLPKSKEQDVAAE